MSDLPTANDEPDDELHDPWHDSLEAAAESYGSPEVLAVVALVLAVASLWGFGLLNGAYYFFQYVSTDNHKTQVVIADLLGAAFALAPIWLGWRAAGRLLPDDPRWVGALARAAVLLGIIDLVLRLVLAVLAAANSDPSTRF